ncbi:PLP-dependent aminotransferase family protein [Lactobacillus sp. UCMA15818]|uniref:aminotransferase-like domain-containing protein n=1 Tax=Lactobacillus sp. UCMA15818 TaxID=2583394 RepID=UPI0025B0B5CC|nr:PLP-dependent aminotransferase family protein [Lactobacillus sp. UCMA15818]MDN2452844.1 PLP-dependent aminotransferase family protein [Lactobacillus sp. UCMA15818]
MIPTFSSRINQEPTSLDALFALSGRADLISFAGGYPDPALFPKKELNNAFESRIKNASAEIFQYRSVLGYEPLRQKIANYTKTTGTSCMPENIMLTQGAQQGIKLLAGLFLDDFDGVVVEAPTYAGGLEAFNEHKPTYYEIPMEDDGMNIDVLEETLEDNDIKLIYTIPNFQNPTGYCMSVEKRRRLAELASKYNVIVIEDDPYRELRYAGNSLPSIKSFDLTENVVTLGSFSKILSPALRCGWLVGAKEIVKQLSSLRLSYDCQSSNILLEGIDEYLEHNDLAAHISELRTAYQQKMDAMLTGLSENLPSECSFSKPKGGFFIWVDLPESLDARDLLNKTKKVAFLEGSSLFATSKEANHLRLNFTGITEEQIKEGCIDLGNTIKSALLALAI